MATKNQREFKKQMKALEKEGKLPDSYYARRGITYAGGGMSIAAIIFILWYTGILQMIISFIMMLFVSGQAVDRPNVEINNNEIDTFYQQTEELETLISDIYIDVYKAFYDNKTVEKEKFVGYQERVLEVYSLGKSDNAELKEISDNYIEDLSINSEIIDFVITRYGAVLDDKDSKYLDTLIDKSQRLYQIRADLWAGIWDNYRY